MPSIMPDVSKHLEKAEKHLQKGKLEQALEEFVNVLDLDPQEDTVRQRAADLCLSLNRERQASILLGDAFDHYVAAERVSEASTTYKKLARLGRVNAERTFRMAQLFDKNQSRREAVETYDMAAADFLTQGRKQNALAALRRILALDPKAENYRREAVLAEQLGDLKGAAASYFELGQSLRREGKPPADAFEKAFDLDPMNGDIAAAHALELIQKKDVAGAVKVLKPFADGTGNRPDLQKKYLECLLFLKRLDDAEPVALLLFDRDPEQIETVGKVIGLWLKAGENMKAAELARELQSHAENAKKMREFLAMLWEISQQNQPGIEFLEYLGTVYNSNNREHEYCETLLRLFDLNFAAHNFLKAADCLDRAVDVDAYEPGHQQRLEMLRGKIDPSRYDLIGTRIVSVMKNKPAEEEAPRTVEELPGSDDKEPTMIEDLMLQAEIFLQYSMKPKAMDRIQRLNRLFPHEEDKNEKLRQLYAKAGFIPRYDESPASSAGVNEQAGAATQRVIDNFARVTEISRSIARQGTVKSALFTTVNEVGRHWNVSRCVAGLASPDKAPTAVIEYCSPGVKKSDTASLVKIIPALQNLCIEAQGALGFPDVAAFPELDLIRGALATLEIRSLMVVPLIDMNEHTGIVILEQCDRQRTWRKVDEVVLKTIAEQVVLAVNNAKLRSLVKNLAVTEEHSGLLKRSSYLDVLLAEVRRAQVQKSPITLMLLSFGSPAAMLKEAGEPALESMMRDIGQLVTSNLRQNDSAIRYDTASIALMLADTGEKNALLVLEKLRKILANVRLGAHAAPLPIAAGIAEMVMQPQFEAADIVTEAINRLEAALERAKLEGANGAFTLTAALPDVHAGAAT
ncbi:MAG TPA: diguanylate cyclase [Terriglobales bacterium]|nr:diguanylate cyclase [Terriglobales bacterium]